MGPHYMRSVSRASPGSWVELNPQPIPPGHEAQLAAARLANEIAHAAVAAEAAGVEKVLPGWSRAPSMTGAARHRGMFRSRGLARGPARRTPPPTPSHGLS